MVAGNYLSTGLFQDQVFPTYTTPAQDVSIDLVGGAKVVDQEDNKGSIFTADIQCSNGVIHGVSRVLQPNL